MNLTQGDLVYQGWSSPSEVWGRQKVNLLISCIAQKWAYLHKSRCKKVNQKVTYVMQFQVFTHIWLVSSINYMERLNFT